MRKTAVFKDDLFLAHDPGFDHVESPQRLKIIYDVLDKNKGKLPLIYPQFKPATPEIIKLNHQEQHFARVLQTAGKTFDALDPDTMTSPASYDAACLAVGALTTGVDLIMADEIDNGFAILRPPGHHAESHRSMGFCLFNNVAVAAKYALKHLGLKRVMIVDWDLHHGNGTQNAFYHSDKVLYISTHQFPYYPGSGSLTECGSGQGTGFTVNIPLPGGQGDLDYATIFQQIITPIGREYQPELILISAGFDIYQNDPLGAMEVTAKGFAYLTRSMVELASEVCHNRLLVSMEGGYNLSGQRDGSLAVLSELCGTAFDSGYPVNLDRKYADFLTNNISEHPAIAEAYDIASQYWQQL
jgi:acetoin utilization deacetylase AcuC-like enzyme